MNYSLNMKIDDRKSQTENIPRQNDCHRAKLLCVMQVRQNTSGFGASTYLQLIHYFPRFNIFYFANELLLNDDFYGIT